jgi:hypothetical protein
MAKLPLVQVGVTPARSASQWPRGQPLVPGCGTTGTKGGLLVPIL